MCTNWNPNRIRIRFQSPKVLKISKEDPFFIEEGGLLHLIEL